MEKSVEIEKLVHAFFQRLNCHLKHCNLSFFYKNIKTLRIEKYFTNNVFTLTSSYFVKENKIKLIAIDDLEHELLHMASSCYKKKYYSGFSRDLYGTGLNEGYTELLSKRYFNKKTLHIQLKRKLL